jgi:hypothetical protein
VHTFFTYRNALIVALLVLLCPVTSFGQSTRLGVRGGLTTSSFTGDPDTDFMWKTGFTAGFPIALRLNDYVFLQPEILFTKKGARASEVIEDTPLDLTFSISYLEFPLFLKFTPVPGNTVRPFMAGGPYAAMNIDARVRYQIQGSSTEQSNQDDSVGQYDFGAGLALGVDMDWNFRTFTLEARYTAGLSNLVENESDPKRNAVLALTLGVAL